MTIRDRHMVGRYPGPGDDGRDIGDGSDGGEVEFHPPPLGGGQGGGRLDPSL